jgi:hypothetical protein
LGRITSKAVCNGCGGETFEVAIYDGGSIEPICLSPTCRQFWPTVGEEPREDAHALKAVGGGGDEPDNVVSSAEEEGVASLRPPPDKNPVVKGGSKEGRTDERPTAGGAAPAVSVAYRYRNLEERKHYMREYMRKRRRAKRGEGKKP